MNKNLIALVGFVLVGIIAYQAYLLGKRDAQTAQETAAPTPKITVEIEKEHPSVPKTVHTTRQVSTPSSNTSAAEPLIDEKRIKEDFNRLFKDIFGNPKVQTEIQKNISQMQQQLQEGMSQFQQEIVAMTAELQKASAEDPLLKELFQNFNFPKARSFKDEGNIYTLDIEVPANEKSSVDVKVKKGFVIVLINKVTEEERTENGVVVKKELKKKKQLLLAIPEDADSEKLETKYDNGRLRLILPKKAAA